MRKLVLAAIAGTVVLLLASCGNKTTQDKVNHKVENAKESVDHAMDKAADKKTGTATINEKLSAERAQNVARILIDEYNISRDRVIVEWVGDREPPFDKPEWNRAVILYVE